MIKLLVNLFIVLPIKLVAGLIKLLALPLKALGGVLRLLLAPFKLLGEALAHPKLVLGTVAAGAAVAAATRDEG